MGLPYLEIEELMCLTFFLQMRKLRPTETYYKSPPGLGPRWEHKAPQWTLYYSRLGPFVTQTCCVQSSGSLFCDSCMCISASLGLLWHRGALLEPSLNHFFPQTALRAGLHPGASWVSQAVTSLTSWILRPPRLWQQGVSLFAMFLIWKELSFPQNMLGQF